MPKEAEARGSGLGARIARVAGRALPLRGDSVDTDRIVPGRYLRCVTFEGIEAHVFEDDRRAAGGRHPFDDPRFRGARVLLVGSNFGCGSSREHAPQALRRWGIRAIAGVSFAEIFFSNCTAVGIPCVAVPREDLEKLSAIAEAHPGAEFAVDLEARAVSARRPGAEPETFPAAIPEGTRRSFLDGTWDAASVLLAEPERIEAVARSLPYLRGFEP
ncbi:MAG: 3-isopropylmalate dehydratase small subunit [Planctomycetota bacterium]